MLHQKQSRNSRSFIMHLSKEFKSVAILAQAVSDDAVRDSIWNRRRVAKWKDDKVDATTGESAQGDDPSSSKTRQKRPSMHHAKAARLALTAAGGAGSQAKALDAAEQTVLKCQQAVNHMQGDSTSVLAVTVAQITTLENALEAALTQPKVDLYYEGWKAGDADTRGVVVLGKLRDTQRQLQQVKRSAFGNTFTIFEHLLNLRLQSQWLSGWF